MIRSHVHNFNAQGIRQAISRFRKVKLQKIWDDLSKEQLAEKYRRLEWYMDQVFGGALVGDSPGLGPNVLMFGPNSNIWAQ